MKAIAGFSKVRNSPRQGGIFATAALCACTSYLVSCGALNPAFVDVVAPGTGVATIDNAPGHVVLQFVNNAEVSERLLNFMESEEGGGLMLTELEKATLRPRVRMRFLITFTDGSVTGVEFVDGSRVLVSPDFDSQSEPDLNQNDLNNAVVLCDVARIEVQPGTPIDVFVPVPLAQYEIVETEDPDTGTTLDPEPVLRETLAPQFRALALDEIDEDGNVVVQRNVGVRDVAGPIENIQCGSVVTVVLEGELSVPFLDEFNIEVPSFDQGDPNSVGSIGGRYEFIVGVR